MIKLSSSNNVKKIVLASSLLIAPTLAFSGEMNEGQDLLTNEQLQILQELNEYAQEGDVSTYSIESKSKQGSQVLMGEWNISYNYNGSQADKIVIDGIDTMDDGEIVSIGSYYPNQTGSGIPFACFDKDATVFTCISLPPAGVDFVGFIFSISGNSIDNGFFATASSIEGVFDGFKNPQYPITGSRGTEITEPETIDEDGPFPSGPVADEASYDNTSGEMTIPVLNYKDTQYKVILSLVRADEEKVIFELTDVQQISATSVFSGSSKQAKRSPFDVSQPETTSGSEASFDDASGELIIPVLNLEGDKFRLILVIKSTGVLGKTMFELVTAEKL